MNWENLSDRSKEYVDRYIRNKPLTREQALQERMTQEIIREYERGTNERLVFA